MIPSHVLKLWQEWGFHPKHIAHLERMLYRDWQRLHKPIKPIMTCVDCNTQANKVVKKRCLKCYYKWYRKLKRRG